MDVAKQVVDTLKDAPLTGIFAGLGTYLIFPDASLSVPIADTFELPVWAASGIGVAIGSFIADRAHDRIMESVPLGAEDSTTFALENYAINPIASGLANAVVFSILMGGPSNIDSLVKPFLIGACAELAANEVENYLGVSSKGKSLGDLF